MRRPEGWTGADVTAKGLLVALLAFSLTHSDWDRFADKAMTARAVLYPALVALVPLLWWLRRRRTGRAIPYPGSAALVLTLPFLIDVAGNALDLYDRVDRFDDICHFVNWALLCTALGLVLVRIRTLPWWAVGALCVGFGAATAIGWEIGEYGAFILDTPEASTAYRDTIGDLALGLSGSIVAGIGFAAVAGRRRPAPTTSAGTS